MKYLRTILLAGMLLAPAVVNADSLILVTLADGKTEVAVVMTPSGMSVITDIQRIKLSPPEPEIKITRPLLILIETGETDQAEATVLAQIRNDLEFSKLFRILDQDSKDANGNPLPLVAEAKRLLAGKPVPQVVGFDGSVAVIAEPLPKDLAAVKALVAKWEVK